MVPLKVFWNESHRLCLVILSCVFLVNFACNAISITSSSVDLDSIAVFVLANIVVTFAFPVNLCLYTLLYKLDKPIIDGRVGIYFRQKVICVTIGCVLNLAAFGAFVGLVIRIYYCDMKEAVKWTSITTLSIGGLITFVVVIVDLLKLLSLDLREKKRFEEVQVDIGNLRLEGEDEIGEDEIGEDEIDEDDAGEDDSILIEV
ncbi:uncharacterized protein BDZ99DRAFT_566491 [Mytilinidion resinicola]|uniref:Uncharacterized protein n=1 Tax=Mytilinidion resinicola TaxID=574789 RepID=A0A6A6Z8S1_9PEZI|nr:uncharacterized protein BDZ99DRAFT_566491 [Mytilinidion resinicola]KAF2816694.1 hypothetical protein BDZ99DRAFT_566491 [Mytilinidion resinicola]